MRRSIVLAVAGLAVTAVAACGSQSTTNGSGSSGSGSGTASGGGGDYCALARQVRDGSSSLGSAFASGNPAFIKQTLAGLLDLFHAAAAAAPAQIAQDWATASKTAEALVGAIANSTDMSGLQSAVVSVEASSSSLSSAADAARTRIDAYTHTACGFTISTDSTSQSSAATRSSSSTAASS